MPVRAIVRDGFGEDIEHVITGGYDLPGLPHVAVAVAHDPGAAFEADDTGEALVAHDPGATYEAAL